MKIKGLDDCVSGETVLIGPGKKSFVYIGIYQDDIIVVDVHDNEPFLISRSSICNWQIKKEVKRFHIYEIGNKVSGLQRTALYLDEKGYDTSGNTQYDLSELKTYRKIEDQFVDVEV